MDMNELVPCPFVKEHRVSRRKLQYHIVKCVKTYQGRKVPCPYNALEYFYPEEIEEHFKYCLSKGDTDAQYISLDPERLEAARRRMSATPFHHNELPEPSERWGLE